MIRHLAREVPAIPSEIWPPGTDPIVSVAGLSCAVDRLRIALAAGREVRLGLRLSQGWDRWTSLRTPHPVTSLLWVYAERRLLLLLGTERGEILAATPKAQMEAPPLRLDAQLPITGLTVDFGTQTLCAVQPPSTVTLLPLGSLLETAMGCDDEKIGHKILSQRVAGAFFLPVSVLSDGACSLLGVEREAPAGTHRSEDPPAPRCRSLPPAKGAGRTRRRASDAPASPVRMRSIRSSIAAAQTDPPEAPRRIRGAMRPRATPQGFLFLVGKPALSLMGTESGHMEERSLVHRMARAVGLPAPTKGMRFPSPALVFADGSREGLCARLRRDGSGLALVVDSLGRILLARADLLRVLHVWKGRRHTDVCWVGPYAAFYHRPFGALELWDITSMKKVGSETFPPHGSLQPAESRGSLPECGVLFWENGETGGHEALLLGPAVPGGF